MSVCEVCGAANRTCGHTVLLLPPVDLAPHTVNPSRKRVRPTLVRPSVTPGRGVAGWRNATVIERGLEGIPLVPEIEPFAAPPERQIEESS